MKVEVSARTIFGAKHALEVLAQMVQQHACAAVLPRVQHWVEFGFDRAYRYDEIARCVTYFGTPCKSTVCGKRTSDGAH